MCESCFNSEISSFRTADQWVDFQYELAKKLGFGLMRYSADNVRNEGTFVYECVTCHQNWELNLPDGGAGGHFVTIGPKKNYHIPNYDAEATKAKKASSIRNWFN